MGAKLYDVEFVFRNSTGQLEGKHPTLILYKYL